MYFAYPFPLPLIPHLLRDLSRATHTLSFRATHFLRGQNITLLYLLWQQLSTMSSTSSFADFGGRCPCHCHIGPDRSGCTCTCPPASSSSTPVVLPLTLRALLAAGRYLIRWRALTFYYDFIPEDKRKTIHNDIQNAAAVIRLHLNHVDVPGTWAQYIAEITRAAASSPSPSTSSSSGEKHSKGRKRSFTSFTRKLRRRFGTIPSSTSSETLESNETRASSNVIRDNSETPSSAGENSSRNNSVSHPLLAMFVTVAGRLQVSRNQLELAFKYYALYVSSDRVKRITAKDLVRNQRYSDLGEIILLDMQELDMFSHTATWEQHYWEQYPCLHLHTEDPSSEFETLAEPTALPSPGRAEGDVEGDKGPSPTAPVAIGSFDRANGIRRFLLGKNHASATEAIAACTEHYFVCLRYEQPRRFSLLKLWSLLTKRGMDKKRKGRAEMRVAEGSYDAAGIEAMQRHHDKHCHIVWKIRATSIAPVFTFEDLNRSKKLSKRRAGADL